METILLYTNDFSERETRQIISAVNSAKPPLVRGEVENSLSNSELKTSGYNSTRFLELYVSDNRAEAIISFLNKKHPNLKARTIEAEATEVQFNEVAATTEEHAKETGLEIMGRKVGELIDQVIPTSPTPIEQQALTA